MENEDRLYCVCDLKKCTSRLLLDINLSSCTMLIQITILKLQNRTFQTYLQKEDLLFALNLLSLHFKDICEIKSLICFKPSYISKIFAKRTSLIFFKPTNISKIFAKEDLFKIYDRILNC